MAKSLAQEEFEQKHDIEIELAKRELYRRSLDTIRIYNPLDYLFAFMYDRYWHRVPAKSTKDYARYLALHYFKKICDKMIGEQIIAIGEDRKKIREKQMGDIYRDKYQENVEIWDRTPKLNDSDLIGKIREVVILGVVEEYGMDEPEPDLREPESPLDFRPQHEQIFSTIDKVIIPKTTVIDEKPPLYVSKKDRAALEIGKVTKTDLEREIIQK